jgi:membrane-associated phospholipid phosphatase
VNENVCRVPKPVTTLEELEKVGEFLLVFAGYLVIERSEAWRDVAGHSLETSIDRVIPFVPGWIYVYVTLWIFSLAPLLYVRSNTFYRPLFASMAATLTFSYVVFVFFPTKMTMRPSLEGAPGFTAWLIRGVYAGDGPYNCFPSTHVALSHLAAWSIGEMDRAAGRVAWILAAAITISALLLKQHYLADVVGGAALAFAVHRLTLGRYAKRCKPQDDDRRSRNVLWALVVAQIVGMIALYVVYRARAA